MKRYARPPIAGNAHMTASQRTFVPPLWIFDEKISKLASALEMNSTGEARTIKTMAMAPRNVLAVLHRLDIAAPRT